MPPPPPYLQLAFATTAHPTTNAAGVSGCLVFFVRGGRRSNRADLDQQAMIPRPVGLVRLDQRPGIPGESQSGSTTRPRPTTLPVFRTTTESARGHRNSRHVKPLVYSVFSSFQSTNDAVCAAVFGGRRPRRARRGAKVVKRLKEVGWEQPGAASEPVAGAARDLTNVTYRLFLALLWGIKGPKVSRRSLGRRLFDTIVARCVRSAWHAKEREPPTGTSTVTILCPVSLFVLLRVPARKQTFVHTHLAAIQSTYMMSQNTAP